MNVCWSCNTNSDARPRRHRARPEMKIAVSDQDGVPARRKWRDYKSARSGFRFRCDRRITDDLCFWFSLRKPTEFRAATQSRRNQFAFFVSPARFREEWRSRVLNQPGSSFAGCRGIVRLWFHRMTRSSFAESPETLCACNQAAGTEMQTSSGTPAVRSIAERADARPSKPRDRQSKILDAPTR